MWTQLPLFPKETWLYGAKTILNGHLSMPVQPPTEVGAIFDVYSEARGSGARFLTLLLFGYLPPIIGGSRDYYRGIAITAKPGRWTLTLKRTHEGTPQVTFISEQSRAKLIRSLFLRSSWGGLIWKSDVYA